MGYISSKLEMQRIDLTFLQMDAMDYCVESYGFKYKHTFSLQCCRMRSSIDIFLFTNGLLY
jgi:hypothetical protein